MESGLGIKYRGGGKEGQESQFTSVYSLFFMQAAIIAHNICSGFKAFKLIRKKKYIWEQHIYLQYKFLQYVYVFVHEAIIILKSTFTSITNMYILKYAIIFTLESNPLRLKNYHIINMHSKARWTILSENVAFWNRWCLRTYIRWTRWYFLIKRGLVFIQLSDMGDYSFFNE